MAPKTRFWIQESIMDRESINTLQHLFKEGPLIKYAKMMCLFLNTYFSHK